MGFVYAGQDKDKTRFKIGRTKDTVKRQKAHRTSNPDSKYYRRYETDSEVPAEAYLKALLADKRIPGAKETFAVSSEEIDVAFVELDRYMTTYLSPKQLHQLELFREQHSNGTFLPSDDATRSICHKLRMVRNEIKRLGLLEKHWAGCLQYQIGLNEGIDGLCKWATQSMGLRVDNELLKTKFPEAWDGCRKELVTRKFLLLDGAEDEELE